MTTRDDDHHDDDHHHDDQAGDHDDRDLDAFLRGDDDLSGLLRGLPQEAPAAALDARIHAQARAALAAPAPAGEDALSSLPPAANDPAMPMAAPPEEALEAADDEEAPRPSNPFGHLRVPMAIAATLVVGVSLTLQLGDWRAPANLQSEPATPTQDRTPAPAAPPADAAPPTRAHDHAPTPAPAPARPVRHAADATVSEPAPAQPAPPAPPRQTVFAPPPPAPAAAPPQYSSAPPLPSPAPAFPDGVQRRSAPPVEFQRAPPAPLMEPAPVAPPPSGSVQVSGSRIAAPGEQAPQAPQAWLARIADLLDQHRDDQARTEWLAFRRAHPDAPVPEPLRTRIDALAPAP